MRILLLSFISLMACGRGNGNSGLAGLDSNANTMYLASEDDLPECNESNNNQLVYIESDSTFKACRNNNWSDVDVQGKQGEKGEIGKQGEAGLSIVSTRMIENDTDNYCTKFSGVESCHFNGGQITKYSSGYIEINASYSYEYLFLGTTSSDLTIDRYGSNGYLMLPPNSEKGFIKLDWSVSRGDTSFINLYLSYDRDSDKASIVYDSNDNGLIDNNDEIITVLTFKNI